MSFVGNGLDRIVATLDSAIFRLSFLGMSENFIRFGMVGVMGLVCDTATVYACRDLVGLYFAGAFGFIVSASANWGMNRIWTYRHKQHSAARVQWMRFLAVNSIGFIFNRGTFFILISISEFCHNQPVIAILSGSLAGLYFNYFLSKRFVFQ